MIIYVDEVSATTGNGTRPIIAWVTWITFSPSGILHLENYWTLIRYKDYFKRRKTPYIGYLVSSRVCWSNEACDWDSKLSLVT